MRADFLLFLDLETTGLDVDRCDVLEVGAVLVRSVYPWRAVATFRRAFAPPPGWQERAEESALAMHAANGLLDECRHAASAADWDADMLAWLAAHAGEAGVLLAGSNIERFDRLLLERWAPGVARRLHHAGIDVGVLRRTGELVGWDPWPASDVHRAMPDALDSLAQWKLVARALGLESTRRWAAEQRSVHTDVTEPPICAGSLTPRGRSGGRSGQGRALA